MEARCFYSLSHFNASHFKRQPFDAAQISIGSDAPLQIAFFVDTLAQEFQRFQVFDVFFHAGCVVQRDAVVTQLPDALLYAQRLSFFQLPHYVQRIEIN